MNDIDTIVYVVDDDPAVLKAVARLLRAAGFKVVGFTSPHRFLASHDPSVPGCVILDLAMPGLNGLELQDALDQADETIPVIFLTGHADVPASVKAMKRGAADFLTKPVNRDDLVTAVGAALARNHVVRQARRDKAELQKRLNTLTPREYEVFEHVVSGKLNKQTAADLGAAEKTIKVHRARVMSKMQVDSLADLVRLAVRAGVTRVDPHESQDRIPRETPLDVPCELGSHGIP